jgi:hypothetical protein
LRPVLTAASWDRRQVRPGNHPVLRCRGLAELAGRWAARGALGGGPAEQVLEAVRVAATVRRPRLAELVRASPWIGRGRAQVIVVNVLLPFAAAAGIAQAERLFEQLPGEPSNRVVRYMTEQLGWRRLGGACQQQGMLYLFNQTCAARACERCPARRANARPRATTEDAEAS